MLATILQILSNPTVITLIVSAAAYFAHKVTSSAIDSSKTLQQVIDGARSIGQALLRTLAPGMSPDALAAELANMVYQQMKAAGLAPESMSALETAMVNALVHDLVNQFVQAHPNPTTISANVRAVIANPQAKAS